MNNTAMNKSIPLYLLEEDNENFIVWQHALTKGMIRPKGNTLIHIDEHIDMGTPRLKSSIFNIENNFEKNVEFAYKELSINSYIIPAIYLGIFDNIHWLQNANSKKERVSRKRIIRTFNDEGKKFKVLNPSKTPLKSNCNYKKFVLFEDSIDSLTITNHHNIILDLNLSYFACVREPGEYQIQCIEITEEEYDQFNNNSKYHPLRYGLIGHRIEAKKENNKYFYVLNDHEEIYADVKRPSKDELLRTIKELVAKLVTINAKFKIITITRSSKSGYVPEDILDFIETESIKELRKHFSIDVTNIDTLIDQNRTQEN